MSRVSFCVAALAVTAPVGFAQADQCMPFYDRAQFEAFNAAEGKTLEGIETFEESNIPPEGKEPLPAPIDQNPNTMFGIGFPNGLTQQNIAIWDNVSPTPNPPGLNPSGSDFALYVIGTGFFGSKSNKVGGDLFLFTGTPISLDLVFSDARYSGVGFELSWFFLMASWDVSVYDGLGQTIGEFQFLGAPGAEPSTTFFGVWCAGAIGRINIFDAASPWPDAIVNIEMWR